MDKRIERELGLLGEGGQKATLVPGNRDGIPILCVIYHDVPTAGVSKGLPGTTNVLVPVPGGYPAGAIDLAGLPNGSPFLGRVKGQVGVHGTVVAENQQWSLVSYHPHSGGGGPTWDQMSHGFHTYLTELIVWLDALIG